ncbi:MAG: substrate-binding domain-containing protein, partial [Chloroflexi bacterium]|nr:substrate-binding domain-containing protein [Chloroflexota bacterium]
MKRLKFAFKHLFFAVLLLSLLVPSYISCTHSKIALKVILAGSLMVPFAQIEKDFELAHPDVDVVLDGHGSIQVIRQITELGVKGDIAAVADYSLLPLLMYPIKDPVTNKPYADWSIQFATNSMGISYTDQSKYAGEINSSNWFEILARSDV